MRLFATTCLLVLCLIGATSAEDNKADGPKKAPPPPLSTMQAADAVLEAVTVKDDAALIALARDVRIDPWLVADELCFRGAHDAADLFAKAAPRVDVDALPAYVEASRTRAPETVERELLAQMNAAMAARKPETVVTETASLPKVIDTVVRVRLAHIRGVALRSTRKLSESVAELRRAADAARSLGWMVRGSHLYGEAGKTAFFASDQRSAAAALSAGLAIAEARKDERQVAFLLNGLGIVNESLGEFAQAISMFKRALELYEALGDMQSVTTAVANLANLYTSVGDYPRAREHHERALEMAKSRDDKGGEARILNNLGNLYMNLGEFPRAISLFRRSYEMEQALGNVNGASSSLGNMGSVFSALGDYAKALSLFEQARDQQEKLGKRHAATLMLGNIGNVHYRLGDYARALAIFERVHASLVALSDKARAAHALGSIASAHDRLGDTPKALSIHLRALAAQKAVGDKARAAETLGNIGKMQTIAGDHAQALETFQRALAEMEKLGNRAGAAQTLSNIGDVYTVLGEYEVARQYLRRSVSASRSLRATPTLVGALQRLAHLHFVSGKPAQALGRARDARRELEGLLGGLGVEQGATARNQHAGLYAIGALAAIRDDDLSEAVTFLESGRAGALLDALDKREVLRWKVESLPPDLLKADHEAQSAERIARRAYDRAVSRGKRAEKRLAGKALDAATERVHLVANRIQRELKQQAGLFYPRPKTLDDIKGSLETQQALVVYGLCLDEALAIVLRTDGERVVVLGNVAEVEAACEALEANNPKVDPAEAISTLRQLLIDPLKLGDDVDQVLVSPEGVLCHLPFGALFKQAVAMTPSGTTHVLLRDEERGAGRGILALGNPDYAGVSESAKAIYYRGRRLSSLPASGPEAETVGTVSLVGAQASEEALRTGIKKERRWKAVHFACHGLIDTRRPMLSSLALSAGGEDDGFLTAREVLRMQIPADLAVLSACETGKGKVVRGEGIVGLTRAFMFAGSPRVICSLWKVDDEATKALMLKFYELWNPKEGEGLSAADALRKAQEHIRSQERWAHPYYWAAWVLWGLPS